MDILYIAACSPYDKVPHAGGQSHNFYLKQLAKMEDTNVIEVSFSVPKELNMSDLAQYNIEQYFVKRKVKFWGRVNMLCALWNPFNKYGCMMSSFYVHELVKTLKRVKKEHNDFDIIIAEWTQMVLTVDEIKQIFPSSKYIAVERDVAFLGYERKYLIATSPIDKMIWKYRYKKLTKDEIRALSKFDMVCTHNSKDHKLLIESGVEKRKIYRVAPYYKKLNINYKPESYNIIFYGAMHRKENYESAIWFIENVLPYIDARYKLYIVGGNPPEKLQQYRSEKVVITGYVENLEEYFNNAFCMVAPLLFGAGIKIKILESMYMGLPVLTNSIGIEGIDAVSGIDYIHCENPNEYIYALNEQRQLISSCSENAKRKMSDPTLDYYKSIKDYRKKMNELINNI